jgi:hypothetical protein
VFDNLYATDREELLGQVPRPDSVREDQEDQFRAAAVETFDFVVQPDNAGATDEDRALNWLLVQYATIYSLTAEMHLRDSSLTEVEARPSGLSGTRNLMDVTFTYASRKAEVRERYRAVVDVTGKYPFLHAPFTRTYDRTIA